MITPISSLKRWFANFKKPTQEQFWAWLDSYWHKSEKIPMDTIDGLENAIRGTASADQLRNHLTDSQAHSGLFDRKVDKEAGKTLTSNDYTNEEKRTNQTNAQKRVVGLTVTGDVDKIITITFADGTAIQAPFTDNDTLPENLADIKLNSLNFNEQTGVLTGVRSDGQQLTVSLDGRYALLGHTHSEYALRTHRHNWDDIDGKPALATEGKIQEAIGKIQVGGRNYLLNSKRIVTNNRNYISEYDYVRELKDGEQVTFSAKVQLGNISSWIEIYNGGVFLASLVVKNDRFVGSFPWKEQPHPSKLIVYVLNQNGSNNTIENAKLERGNIPTDWSPAPEDLLVSNNARASSSITLTHAHNNATIFLEGITGVDMTGLEDLDSVSFRKCFTTGHVNFATTNGKQIVYTGDSRNMQEGGEGSTAVVSVYGNKIYVDIRNV